jgi:hypothetical protein
MEHFAGLDVSVKQTSVRIVDGTGRIVREVKVASEPDALLQVLKNPAYRFAIRPIKRHTQIGQALLQALCATPLSLRFSPEGNVSLSENTASAEIGRPLTATSVAGVNRRAHRRAYRRGYYGYGSYYRPYRYGYGTYQPYSYYGSGYGTYRPWSGYGYGAYGYQPWWTC